MYNEVDENEMNRMMKVMQEDILKMVIYSTRLIIGEKAAPIWKYLILKTTPANEINNWE